MCVGSEVRYSPAKRYLVRGGLGCSSTVPQKRLTELRRAKEVFQKGQVGHNAVCTKHKNASELFLNLTNLFSLRNFFFFFLVFFGAALTAHGSSQARGRIGATAACLGHSHSHAGSKLHL